jgi:ribosomal protein S18 acetylase RimI-like enzyme
MTPRLRPLHSSDIEGCLALWQQAEGVVLREASDQPESIAAFLERNPGLSWVAESPEGALVAALLCGHDGRRAYLYHLAVRTEWRQLGCGRAMVNAALERLKRVGIPRCHAFVSMENEAGKRFWENLGAERREDIALFTLRL